MLGRPGFCHRAVFRWRGPRTDRTHEVREPYLARPVPTCCRSVPVEEERRVDQARIALHFDRKASQCDPSELPEPAPISVRLLDLLGDIADIHPSVLDLGCGDGAGAIRLLQEGAGSVTGIDLSSASIESAQRRAASAGLGPERVRFAAANVASVVLQPHDWVLLDRVICCYRDRDRLVGNALTAASRRFAFSVPESRGWRGVLNAIGWRIENMWKAIVSPDHCRGYVHEVRSIEQNLEAAGFRKLRSGHGGLWYAAVFERGATVPGEPANGGDWR